MSDYNFLLGSILKSKGYYISVAESCTGGLISKLITDVSGSSEYFYAGLITYSNTAKISLLGVEKSVIERFGAVSQQCAEAMVKGLYKKTNSDVCISVTGIAGPGGGSYKKPVGLVYVGFIVHNFFCVKKLFFKGDRYQIRKQTANFCIKFTLDVLQNGYT